MGVQISSSRAGNAQLIQSRNKIQNNNQEVVGSKSPKVQEHPVSKMIRMMRLGKHVDTEA